MNNSLSPEIQSFIDYLKFEKRYSVHTVIAYETDLNEFFDFLNTRYQDVHFTAVTAVFIRSWLAHLKLEKLTSRSINRKMASLRSFFKFMLKQGTIKKLPTLGINSPKQPKRLPSFLKESETQQMLRTVNTCTEDWNSQNAKMMISLFYFTGIRLSELINLREKHIDLRRGLITVLGKGNKERVIPITEGLISQIIEYRELKMQLALEDKEYLMVTEKGKKLYPKYAWSVVNKVLAVATTLERKSPHVLRHSFATHLMNNGAALNAVKELLGHSSLAATQLYTHNSIGQLREVHRKAHPKA